MKNLTTRYRAAGACCPACLILGCCTSFLLASCGILNLPPGKTETVEIRLPEPHPALALAEPGKVPSYTLRWYDADGNRKEMPGVRNRVSLELETGLLTPVLLFPETGTDFSGALPCAGALYPAHAGAGGDSAILEAGWMRGITSKLAEEICLGAAEGFGTGRIIASHFNWIRFEAKLAVLDDPLAFDRGRFREAVLAGDVSVYDISSLEKYPVSFHAPAGTIQADTPFIPAWPGGAGFSWPGTDEIALLAAEGQTCYYGTKGSIVIQTENGKQACAFFRRYSLQD